MMQPVKQSALDALFDSILSLIEADKTGIPGMDEIETNIETLALAKAIKANIQSAKEEATTLTEAQRDAFALKAGFRFVGKLGGK